MTDADWELLERMEGETIADLVAGSEWTEAELLAYAEHHWYVSDGDDAILVEAEDERRAARAIVWESRDDGGTAWEGEATATLEVTRVDSDEPITVTVVTPRGAR